MNKTIVIPATAIVAFLVASCSSTLEPNPFADFLNRNSLTCKAFDWKTNDIGYAVDVVLASTQGTNCLLVGCLILEDATKQEDRYRREREAWRHTEEQKWQNSQQNIRTNSNLLIQLECEREHLGWITAARALDSTRIKERFPGCQLFTVTSFTRSMNPLFVGQPLVIGTNVNDNVISAVFVLGNAPTVAAFMSQYKQEVGSIEKARELLDLFAELQSWQICNKMPAEVADWHDAKTPDWVSKWKYIEETNASGWSFFAVFLTDPKIRSFSQYQIDVLHDGTISVKELMHMGSSGGYM